MNTYYYQLTTGKWIKIKSPHPTKQVVAEIGQPIVQIIQICDDTPTEWLVHVTVSGHGWSGLMSAQGGDLERLIEEYEEDGENGLFLLAEAEYGYLEFE